MVLNFGLLSTDRERVITTYDFFDIAQDRALETFWLAQIDEGATEKYSLTNTRFPSTTTNSQVATTATSFTIMHNKRFETLMDEAIIIGGDVTFSIAAFISSAGGTEGDMFVSGALFVSGAALTNFGNVTSKTLESANGGSNESFLSMKKSIPETKIKKGEYLRADIETWAKGDAGGAVNVNMGWDPLGGGTHGWTNEHDFGSTNSAIDSASRILIPIKLQL